MKKLRKWDPVIIIAGKHKGKISTIETINKNSVIVKDINVVKKAIKWQWFVKKTLPIDISNVMYYLAKEKKATKIKIELNKNNKKIRMTKKTNVEIK